MTFSTDHSQLLLAPLLPGDSLTAEFRIGRMVQRLDVRQEAGTPDPMFTFRDPVALEAAHVRAEPRGPGAAHAGSEAPSLYVP